MAMLCQYYRFDLPKEYRSYVQSKGRARKLGAKYVMLVNQEEQDAFRVDLDHYHQIEKVSIANGVLILSIFLVGGT